MAEITLNAMSRPPDRQGRLYWRIRGPDPSTGRRVTLATGRWTETEAEAELERYRAKKTLGLELRDASTKLSRVSELVTLYTAEMGERLGADHPYVVQETNRLAHVIVHLGSLAIEGVLRHHLEGYAARRRADPCRTGRPVARKSIVEELNSLRRAFAVGKSLRRIAVDPPLFPSLKAVPDDARPARRLTEAEVRALVTAAAAEDDALGAPGLPGAGTRSRELFDLVTARSGITTSELRAQLSSNDLAILRTMAARGRFVVDGDRWSVAEDLPTDAGLWSLLTVLAWSGRRPVAVFGARRRDCERLLDTSLPRADRLMFWAQDKAGVGRGLGPVTEPALQAIVDRAQRVTDPGALLWTTARGLPWTPERLSRVFDRIAARAGVEDVQPYDLRRFAVTQILAEAQGQIAVAQQYTGHRSTRALLRYLYAPQGAAEALAQAIGWSSPELVVTSRR